MSMMLPVRDSVTIWMAKADEGRRDRGRSWLVYMRQQEVYSGRTSIESTGSLWYG